MEEARDRTRHGSFCEAELARHLGKRVVAGVAVDGGRAGGGMTEPKRGYAWRRLPCGCHVVWDDRLGPEPPCRACDAAGFRTWAERCGLVSVMDREGVQ